jgi:hypothetical protein
MSESQRFEMPKPRPHGLGVRQDLTGTVEDLKNYPYHVGTYDCQCGKNYLIFVDQVHFDCGERFGKYVGQVLEYVHKNGNPHPDVIGIPMEAEFHS